MRRPRTITRKPRQQQARAAKNRQINENGTFSLFKNKNKTQSKPGVSRPQHWWHLGLGSLSRGLFCVLFRSNTGLCPIHACGTLLPHLYDKHSCLQVLPCVPWGQNCPSENHWSKNLALLGLICVGRVIVNCTPTLKSIILMGFLHSI